MPDRASPPRGGQASKRRELQYMTAADLMEQLRLLPPETLVLVEGYETGFDAVVLLRQTLVARFPKAQDWDGGYREVRGEGPGDTRAAVLLGNRGHRRRSGVDSHQPPSPKSSADGSPSGTFQVDALLEAEAFATLRGCPPESLPEACAAHRIFAVVIDGVPLYPAFFVDPRFDQTRLEAITKLLGHLSGGSKWQFFTSAKGSLSSVTPLHALLAGRYDDVRASARAFSER